MRVVAATNRDLEREVNSGRFREDLYYRLAVITVRVPPLRERLDDLPILVTQLPDATATPSDKAHLFTPEVLAEMRRHDWPGNVRELATTSSASWCSSTLPARPAASRPVRGPRPRDRARPAPPDVELPFKEAKDAVIDDFERAYLAELLRWAGGNVSKAARKAQLDRMYLHRLFQRYGLRSTSSLGE